MSAQKRGTRSCRVSVTVKDAITTICAHACSFRDSSADVGPSSVGRNYSEAAHLRCHSGSNSFLFALHILQLVLTCCLVQSQTAALHKATVDGAENLERYRSPELRKGLIPSYSFIENRSGVEHHQSIVDRHAGNNSYYLLIRGPARLSKTSGEQARFLTHVPSFRGTGATFSYWYRHTPFKSGVYLFWAFDDDSAVCWSLWVEDGAIWYDNPKGVTRQNEYIYFKDLGMSEKYFWQGDKFWRHVALQFDESTDRLRLFMDGKQIISTSFDSAVSKSDCTGSNRKLAIGHSNPGWTYGQEVELNDLRLYVHKSRPLSAGEISGIANAPTNFSDQYKCVVESDEALIETTNTDAWGHDCVWYYNQYRSGNKAICDLKGAKEQCPQACEAKQQCYANNSFTEYRVWDRTRLISSMLKSGIGVRARNGTLCLASHHNRNTLYQHCLDWHARKGAGSKGGRGVSASDDEAIKEYLTNMNVGRLHPRLNVTDCDEMRDAIDDLCSFDSGQVSSFTKDMKEHGGNYTIAFWIKPHGRISLNEAGRFHPTLTLWSSISPPQHQLSMGLWYNVNGEVRTNSACHPGSAAARDIFENIELQV